MNMELAGIKDKLRDFFENSILYNESMDEIGEEDSLIEGGYIDSTGIIELVAYVEKAFEIRVRDEEIIPENFDTMKRICMYIYSKTQNYVREGMIK